MIKAFIFDLDGTLLNRDESVKSFIAEQYERLYETLKHLPRETYIQRFIELDHRGYVWKYKVYRQLVDEFDIQRMTGDELLHDYLNNFKENCIPFPKLLEILEELKKNNFLIGIITNGKGQFQMNNIKALKIDKYADTILISEWEGVKKPDPTIFRRAAERLKVDPENCVFIGDHPENDVKAAQNVGMVGIWKRDYQWSEGAIGADYTIDDLEEILKIINR
ncbi:putative hydrolase of the HAD superfamily [Halobacillus karajensis]|uniref:(S)-2-haloacid dehalogenase 4A n=1 Tax=Halobacillus karajensis TaxID=195088 RepID=A0A024P6L3_9BACI|nr:HAD family hydrolase [Halobacillus karajensis]CDQ18169.1 (S)-2-haloacid dehalogenase 4A [Halobacillus karajensis]CDQ24520.1 (S)-2-haloacid dehalogenase 4A [Halobacillus karajensis]CDQ29232.1 (S)-2-haloacid dehalogenase 4A [Halobacillus karajensis]SEH57951.1 putative hydrolase of the HAD superfamily [Halobacillus karajensis]